ncbi:MAG TPA: hypothetical protein VIJ25_12070 [Methylococcales bacterium]
MELINTVGEFPVTIVNPQLVERENNAFDVVVSFVTEDKTKYINHNIIFDSHIFQSGSHQGDYRFRVNAELCEKLGMTAPFDPANIEQLEGKKASITTVEDTFKGKTSIKVQWVNQRREKIDKKKASDIWAKMNEGLQPIDATGTDDEKPY